MIFGSGTKSSARRSCIACNRTEIKNTVDLCLFTFATTSEPKNSWKHNRSKQSFHLANLPTVDVLAVEVGLKPSIELSVGFRTRNGHGLLQNG